VIICSTCTLTDPGSDEKFTTVADDFGDFWFEGLNEGTFSLETKSNGKMRTIDPISTEKDVNLE